MVGKFDDRCHTDCCFSKGLSSGQAFAPEIVFSSSSSEQMMAFYYYASRETQEMIVLLFRESVLPSGVGIGLRLLKSFLEVICYREPTQAV